MDPSGHVWTIATRVEETTEEERQQRLACLPPDQGSSSLHKAPCAQDVDGGRSEPQVISVTERRLSLRDILPTP
jgi:hypothetical protein